MFCILNKGESSLYLSLQHSDFYMFLRVSYPGLDCLILISHF